MADNFRTSGQFRILQNLLKIGVDLIGRGVETEEDVEAAGQLAFRSRNWARIQNREDCSIVNSQ